MRSTYRLFRYSLVGGGTFALDMALLLLLIELGTHSGLAAALSFFACVSLNFFISRHVVFKGSTRRMGHGYGLFLTMAAVGAALTGLGVEALAAHHVPLYLSRPAMALPVGLLNYLFNLYVNFRVAGRHH